MSFQSENTDDVVVSGMAGRFPASRNVREFEVNLMNKVDMTSDEDRWSGDKAHMKRSGKISDIDKFDAAFFAMLNKQARYTDPQMRILLEHSYEAIIDAGVSPRSLMGKNVGVIVACSTSEASEFYVRHALPAPDGAAFAGNAIFFLANKISYTLGLCGPSLVVDTACSGAGYALDYAFRYMKGNACDAMIVAGSQLDLTPYIFSEFTGLGILASDGISRIFDEDSKGFVRAETISVVFLQRRADAKRVYAQVVHSLVNNDGFKKEGPSLPSKELQRDLMTRLYREINLDPREVNFFEAHATGTKLGDAQEMAAIDEVFCQDRASKLTVGSVKSCMGHAEAASAMPSIVKILIAFESGKFPPNINQTKLREDIPALAEGRVDVPAEVVDLTTPYVAMNSFGLGGSNAHVLFKRTAREKVNGGIPSDDFERTLLWSGRTEDSIHAIFDDIASRPLDAEYIALLQSSQTQTPDANSYRGSAVFKQGSEGKAVCTARSIQHFNGIRRPVVFAFAGMGTQWHGMGKDLLKIPLFADSIQKCQEILLARGIDLREEILNSTDESVMGDIVKTYLGVISIEIALTDVLRALGVTPDFIVGHSVGEIACAYADGCLSMEEALTVAFLRAKALKDLNIGGGAMAVIEMSYEELEKALPQDIDIACRNNQQSSTISGPAEAVSAFVERLRAEKVFAAAVNTAGIAFHSRQMAAVGREFRESLQQLLKSPRARSAKWITSTYVDESEQTRLCDTNYQVDNVTNTVFFKEAISKLPGNALIVELSPHGILQSIMRVAMGASVHVSLASKSQADGRRFFVEAIGRAFQYGVDCDVGKLYAAVNFPVSRGTPKISPLIKWNHQDSCFVPRYDQIMELYSYSTVIDLATKENAFLLGHIIDGSPLMPAAYWICNGWKQVAFAQGMPLNSSKVVFRDFVLQRATKIAPRQEIAVSSSMHRNSGRLEIHIGQELLCMGTIVSDDDLQLKEISAVTYAANATVLTGDDFYKHARVLGYSYSNEFSLIREITHDGMMGRIAWTGNWVTFIDSIFQAVIMSKNIIHLHVPNRMAKLSIDAPLHMKMIGERSEQSDGEEVTLPFVVSDDLSVFSCGGVRLERPVILFINRKKQKNILTEFMDFVAFEDERRAFELIDALRILIINFSENLFKSVLSFIEVHNGDETEPMLVSVETMSNAFYIPPFNMKLLTTKPVELENVEVISDRDISTFSGVDAIFGRNLSQDKELVDKIEKVLTTNGVVVSNESSEGDICNEKLEVLSQLPLGDNTRLIMMRFKPQSRQKLNPKVIRVTSKPGDWLEDLKREIQKFTDESHAYDSLLLYSQGENSGLFGFFNCLRFEMLEIKFRCVIIEDNKAPDFDLSDPFYESQLEKGHAVNVYRSGQWGSYRHLELKSKNTPESYAGHCFVNYSTRGSISSLKWHEGHLNAQEALRNGDDDDLIRVQYASLNFKDVVCTLGYIPDNLTLTKECVIGLEFSGVRVKSGERVAGFTVEGHAMSSYIKASDAIVIPVPDEWTLEDAATTLMAYFTIVYAFRHEHLKSGQSVLVHSGAGGVGQAALHLAFSRQLEVFTTVGTEEKRKFLLETFPLLKPENIGNSRDMSFLDMIMERTQGRGVNYVLNSLIGDKMIASLECVCEHGSFIEIGRADVFMGTKISLEFLQKNIALRSNFADFQKIREIYDGPTMQELKLAIREESSFVKPLSRTVFDACDVVNAFQYMSTGNHIGKVVLKLRDSEHDAMTLPINVTPRFYCHPEHSYIVVGGLGGLGLEFSQWLIRRQCRKLVLTSRRGVSDQYQAFKICKWKSHGAQVTVSIADVTTEAGCEEVIEAARALGEVGGIFNFAAVLRDGALVNLTEQSFDETMLPKVTVTRYLHEVSLKRCPHLKHFVVYSSVVSGRGSPGQSNYGMSNAMMEKIIEQRHEMGLPAKAIQWGPIGDVGMLGEAKTEEKGKTRSRLPLQSLASFLEHHDCLLMHPSPIVACTVTLKKVGQGGGKKGLIDMIMEVLNIEDRKSISMSSTFSQLGIDSLAGVELQQTIEREYDITVTAKELRTLTLAELEAKTLKKAHTTE